MKKLLLNLSLLLAFNFCFAQQNKQNNYSAETTNFSSPAQANYKSVSVQPIPTTTTSTCMSINLPTPTTWTLSNYGTGTPIFTNGFVNGPNTYLDKEKAMYFDVSASANTMITQVYVGFNHAYSATPSKTVAIRIYDGTGGTVGAALGTSTITMSTIMTDVAANRYSVVFFSTPINLPVSKKFFTSVDITGLQWPTVGTKDSLSIISNTSPQTTPTPAWERQSNNLWYNYSNAVNSWSLNISLLIHPFLTQAPIVATYTTSGSTICETQSVNYNSVGSTAGTYQWSFGAIATPTAAGAIATATYSAAGTYTTLLIVSDACGSLAAAQSTVTVKVKPIVTASPTSTTICNGNNVTLSGGGASTYTWTGGATNAVSFAPSSTTNYSVSGTAANGCTNTAVASVSVNPIPSVTANTTASTICNGSNVTLSGSGATTYTWTSGVTNGLAFAPTSSNTYTVIGSTNNCTNTAVVSVSVNPVPIITANTSAVAICNGSNVTLSGSGATTYTWSSGVTNGLAFAPTSSNTYTVIGSTNNCTNTAMVSVTVNPIPSVTANASTNNICNGSNVTLTGGGATTYTWSSGVTDGTAFFPTSTNTYTVIGSTNNCTNTAVVSVSVNPIPNVTASTTATTICSGSNVTLSGAGATSYTWTSGVTNGLAFSPTSSNTYTVTGSTNNCTNTAVVSVSVNASPNVTANATATLICLSNGVTLSGAGAASYTWSSGVSNGVSFTPTLTNTYSLTGSVANGCSGTATIQITVSACTGIQSLVSANASIVVFPNPNNGEFTISSNKTETISIINDLGQIIENFELNQPNNFSYKVTNLQSGIYFLVSNSIKQKIVVTH